VTTITTELAALLPCLAGALRRDTVLASRGGSTSASLVNADVLHAMEVLHRDIPAVTRVACEAAGEPWQPRTVPACLIAIPRLESRLRAVERRAEAFQLEDAVHGWVRVTKQALGLRTPDIPLGETCPECHQGGLIAAGQEGFLRKTPGHGITVEWETAGRIYCTWCGYAWPMAQWPFLGRRLREALESVSTIPV
jgi:hypothetical protein